ncbi:MAG: TIR domain-containing protein [Pseudomonadota bacterium]
MSHAWASTEHLPTLLDWLSSPLSGTQDAQRFDPAIAGALFPIATSIAPGPSGPGIGADAGWVEAEMTEMLRQADLLAVPVGMYATHNRWLTKEIAAARRFGALVLAVNPWGPLRAPSVVATHAALIADWNRDAVRSAVWSLGRADRKLSAPPVSARPAAV